VAGSASLAECAGMPSGRSCQPLCLAGRAVRDSRSIRCRNGNWQYQSATSCDPTGCPSVPAVQNSQSLDSCAGTQLNKLCELLCMPGFDPVGQLICIEGEWTRPSCVPKTCSRAPSVQGVLLTRCVGTASGRTCKLICPVGQRKTGDLLCLQGDWQNQKVARCTSDAGAPCRELPIIINADASRCRGTRSGSKCQGDICLPGYQIDSPLMCVAGTWTAAQCLAKPCLGVPKCNKCTISGLMPRDANERHVYVALQRRIFSVRHFWS